MSNDIRYNPDLSIPRWVGYFDLLGVKQLHKTKNHISIFVAYSKAIEEVKQRVWENTGYAWFSDTFIVYTDDDSVSSFNEISDFSRWFFYFLITSDIPVRGAISCDNFYVDRENNLFFGEALIEAYEYGENQDWIGLLLCPSAEKRIEQLKKPAELRLYYANTKIPFQEEPKKLPDNLKNNLPACILGNWVSVNNKNPIIKRLSQMKDRINDSKIRAKYERSIKFLQKHNRALSIDR